MAYTNTATLTLDDIIFQTRNQAYGAFDLRRNYQRTLTRALALGIGLFLISLAAPTLYSHFFGGSQTTDDQAMVSVGIGSCRKCPAGGRVNNQAGRFE